MSRPHGPAGAPVIQINGWPGVGKMTVGRMLAEALRGRLLDNHLVLDPAFAMFPLGSDEWWRLGFKLRRAVFAAAREIPSGVPLVMTNILYEDCRASRKVLAMIRSLAAHRQAPVVAVTLTASPDEHARRVASPERGRNKLTDPARALGTRGNPLLRPAADVQVEVDTTDLAPEDTLHAVLDALPAALARFDCQGCGACCAYSETWPCFDPEDGGDGARVPDDKVAPSGDRMAWDRAAGRCAALEGEVGWFVSCSVYGERPAACRDCVPMSRACVAARREALPRF